VGSIQPLEDLHTLREATLTQVDPPTSLLSEAPATLLLPGGSPPRSTAQGQEAPAWPLQIGHQLRGRYHLVQLIANSGMSVVYRAVDTQLGLRQVAVKTAGKPELLAIIEFGCPAQPCCPQE